MLGEQPFLDAIVENPHTWAPRLVFADWLEEQGDPRGELIRLLYDLHQPRLRQRRERETRLRRLLTDGVPPVAPMVTNSIGMKLIAIPPGSFRMGSPRNEEGHVVMKETRHRVTLTRGFFLGLYPVTQEEWDLMGMRNPSHWRGPRRPVDDVERDHCVRFCELLTEREQKRYRLPTEAEWEYACRAGTSTPFYFGEKLAPDLANFDRHFRSEPPGQTMDVGMFPPNAWGLHDMHGNVWEWCADTFDDYPSTPMVDPVFANGPNYVLRGGSWYNSAERARSAARHDLLPNVTGSAIGFRVCLEPPLG